MMQRITDFAAYSRYAVGAGCVKTIGGQGSALVVSSAALQLLAYHVRFSQNMYGSSLLFIAGFDITAGVTAITYGFLLCGTTHCNIVVICSSASQIATIEDAYLNATWYERETAEMLGVSFVGSKDGRSLLLPYNSTANPLKKIMPTNATSTLGVSRAAESLAWFQI